MNLTLIQIAKLFNLSFPNSTSQKSPPQFFSQIQAYLTISSELKTQRLVRLTASSYKLIKLKHQDRHPH